MAETAEERRARWIKATGLPPPDERGWTPRPDDEWGDTWARLTVREKLAVLKNLSRAKKFIGGPRRVGHADPSWRNDGDPSFENAVRLLEEACCD